MSPSLDLSFPEIPPFSFSRKQSLSVCEEHLALIEELREEGYIVSDKVYESMRAVDFKNFFEVNPYSKR